MIKRALRPIRRRVRWLRAAHGLFLGLLAGAAFCLGLTAASFFTPIESMWRNLAAAFGTCTIFGSAIGALMPVSLMEAARRADGAGLRERARTALAFEGEQGAMLDLQRADAHAHLTALPVRQALPFRLQNRIWLPAIASFLLTGVLLLLPNPQHSTLNALAQERKSVRAQADVIEKAADALPTQTMTDAERGELRRLTDEMTRELRAARDKREALSTLDEKQKQIERLQKEISDRMAAEAAQALGSQPGLKGLADALDADDASQLQTALAAFADALASDATAPGLAAQLSQAASIAPAGALQQGLSDAAAAASAGDSAKAAQALSSALSSAGATGSNIASLMQLARTGVAQAGSSQSGSAQGPGQGQGAGTSAGSQGAGMGAGGAGKGTTQRDIGYSPGMSQSSQQMGGGPIQDRVGSYERIYDPTRLGGDSEASHVEGQKGEGESQQLALGPGIGDFSGAIPYDQVIGEYRQAAASAMRRVSLPPTMQDWVNRYFNALID